MTQEGSKPFLEKEEGSVEGTECEYKLCAVISHIAEGIGPSYILYIPYSQSGSAAGHLVLHTWTSTGYGSSSEEKPIGYTAPSSNGGGQWILFNDFAATPVQLDDALKFSMPW